MRKAETESNDRLDFMDDESELGKKCLQNIDTVRGGRERRSSMVSLTWMFRVRSGWRKTTMSSLMVVWRNLVCVSGKALTVSWCYTLWSRRRGSLRKRSFKLWWLSSTQWRTTHLLTFMYGREDSQSLAYLYSPSASWTRRHSKTWKTSEVTRRGWIKFTRTTANCRWVLKWNGRRALFNLQQGTQPRERSRNNLQTWLPLSSSTTHDLTNGRTHREIFLLACMSLLILLSTLPGRTYWSSSLRFTVGDGCFSSLKDGRRCLKACQ